MEATLSRREFQMVELTAFGLAQKEIADKLRISAHTVDVTIRKAKEKLHVQKSTELTAWYFISNYKITLNLSPITRAMISLSFLSIITFCTLFSFKPERTLRSTQNIRTTNSRVTGRARRFDSATDFNLNDI